MKNSETIRLLLSFASLAVSALIVSLTASVLA